MGKKSEAPLEVHSEQPEVVPQLSLAKRVPSAPDVNEDVQVARDTSSDMAAGFVGQWNRLVSTTNWEKGRIICEWRKALRADGQPVTDYSDEAWGQWVGHVSSQHVGRLRRVFQRFGDIHEQYAGLYWSHFQAALDWPDAEMWLEGAIQNGWSVSRMRGRRWEALGTPVDEQAEQAAHDAAAEEEILDEDAAEPVSQVRQPGAESPDGQETGDPSAASQQAVPGTGDPGVEDHSADGPQEQVADEPSIQTAARQRLGVVCDDLPDNIAEAFEQFKLAIIAQRRAGWRAISRDGVIDCLDALKELVGAS
jgi:hypothetical protein